MKNPIRLFIFLLFSFSSLCLAQTANEQSVVIKKVAVFPLQGLSGTEAEEAWWTVRDLLTREDLFLVASRRLMMNRGVFQPRGDLSTADRIILGKILEAEAIVVMYIENRDLAMKVYSGVDGALIWEQVINLHPALTIKEQIVKVATQMTLSFIRDVPYRGSLVRDELSGKVLWQVETETLAWVQIGKLRGVGEGDRVHFVRGGFPFSVSQPWRLVAEGVVQKISEEFPGRVLVKINKMLDPQLLIEGHAVHFPDEAVQVDSIGIDVQNKNANLAHEYLSQELREKSELKPAHDKTSSVLTWIGHLSLMILMAF